MTHVAVTTSGTAARGSYSIGSILVFLLILGFGYGMIRWRNRGADRGGPAGRRSPGTTTRPGDRERPVTDPNRWEATGPGPSSPQKSQERSEGPSGERKPPGGDPQAPPSH